MQQHLRHAASQTSRIRLGSFRPRNARGIDSRKLDEIFAGVAALLDARTFTFSQRLDIDRVTIADEQPCPLHPRHAKGTQLDDD